MRLNIGSSPHFCMLAAIFTDSFSADACDRSITALRRHMKKPADYEFHFSHCPDSVRMDFLRCVAVEQFSYHAFIIDKNRLHSAMFNNSKYFY